MSKKHYLKRGDRVSIIADDEYVGEITLLTPYHISIQSMSPIGCYINRVIPEKYRKHGRYAGKIDETYCATECGIFAAIDMLFTLGNEESRLLEDPFRLKDMIDEYRQKESELGITNKKIRCKKDRELFYELDGFLVELKEKYYPDIRNIEFDEDLIDKLQGYVQKIHSTVRALNYIPKYVNTKRYQLWTTTNS